VFLILESENMFNKKFILLFALLLTFGISPAFATWPADFANVTNFHNVENFTTINSMSTFFGKDTGPVNYVYIPLDNLNSVTSTGWLFRGYNNNVFKGNVSAYPYQFGFLVSLKTISGNAYNSLALFWNQSIPINTSSMIDQQYNISIDRNAVKYPFYQYLLGNQNLFRQSLNGKYVYPNGELPITFLGCTYQNNQYCSWSFRPKIPYLFIETAPYTDQNITIDFINYGGVEKGTLSVNSIALNLKGNGALAGHVTSPLVSPLVVLINGSVSNPAQAFQYGANQIFLASNQIGWNENTSTYGLYNSSTDHIGAGWLYTGTNNRANITIYTNNAPSIDTLFYLIPAYTTQYANSIIYYNATPLAVTSNNCTNVTGWYTYKYRKQINDVNWSSTFTTYAYPAHLNTSYKIISNNAGYLILNMTRYSDMGSDCNNVYFNAFNNVTGISYGTIDHYTLDCNSTAVYLLSNKTDPAGNQYTSFFIYINSSKIGVSNTLLKNQWQPYTNVNSINLYDTAFATSYFVSLKNPLFANPNSMIIYSLNGFFEQDLFRFDVNYSSAYRDSIEEQAYPSGFITHIVNDYTSNPNQVYLKKIGGGFYTSTLSCADVSYVSNTFVSNSYFGGCMYNGIIKLRLVNNTANVTKLYSTQYTPNPIGFERNPNSCFVKKPSKPIPTISNLNVSASGTILAGNTLTNSTLWGNVVDVNSHLTGAIAFYDITIPLSLVVLLALIEILCIALSFATNNEWLVIFSLVAANFIGLILMLGVTNVGIGFLLISIIAAGYYVIKNAHKWWK
jgi:hypothetical protein